MLWVRDMPRNEATIWKFTRLTGKDAERFVHEAKRITAVVMCY